MEKKTNKTRFLETEADLQGDRLSAFFISIPILDNFFNFIFFSKLSVVT